MRRFVFLRDFCWVWGAVVVVCSTGSFASDWAQFQGPMRDGSSPETGLLRSWPAEGPKVLWSQSLGEGFAGAAIRDGEVYLVDRVDDKEDIVRCFSLETGEELWRYAYAAEGTASFSGSRSAPLVTAEYVYSVGLTGQLQCIDRKTHELVWGTNLFDDYAYEDFPGWGFSQSPSLYGDLVIVAPQGTDHTVVAYKAATGEVAWSSGFLGDLGYASPLVTTLAGVDQVVQVSANGKVTGISVVDGKVLWKYTGWSCDIPVPYPVVLPGDRLFITAGYGAGSAMIQIVGSGDGLKAEELFTTEICGAQIHQPLLYEKHLYINSNGNKRRDGMQCLDLAGGLQWQTKDTEGLPLFGRGGLLLVDDMILNFDAKTGILHLVDPSPDGYEELAQAKIFEGKQMWAPMALSNGKLVLRSQDELRCLDLRNP